ncbi:MAG: hypothetical protein ACK5NA_09165 [Enterococcus sp.]
MELLYRQQGFTTKVIYGETLFSQLKQSELLENQACIILTNQRYYDLFSQKINRLFPNQQFVDWYICTNSTDCNNLDELSALLEFVKRFSSNEEYLIIGFGNQGIMELASFFQKVTTLSTKLWLWPVSLRAFSQSLVPTSKILQTPHVAMMQVANLSESIFYDQTISEQQSSGKLIDFLVLVRCGVVCDYDFLRILFENYPTQSKLFAQPLTGMLEKITYFYSKRETNITNYGKLFEQSFYLTENGHLLSSEMKQLMGLIFHLCWNTIVTGWTFHLENFLRWLASLGYPIEWIPHLSQADYLQQVYALGQKSKKILVLKKISIIEEYRRPSEKELLLTMELYQKIVREIRGN